MIDDVSSQYKEALRRGHMAVAKGRPVEAVQHYQEAGRLAGQRPLPFTSMGSIYLQMRKPQEALRAYEEALRREPNDLDALRGRARALAATGKKKEALAAAQRADELESMQRAGQQATSDVQVPAAALERLVSEASRARLAGDLDAAVGSYLAAAQGFEQQNSFDAALDACFRALEARPGDIDVHLLMAGLYLRRGWTDHGVERVTFLDKRLRLDEEPQRRAALTALARDHRGMDPVLDRLAALG